jgi:phage terminase small subunit
MARNRSPNRDKAFDIYKKHYANITIKEIAAILGEKERNITEWKVKDLWKEKYNPEGGAPFGNKNAIKNTGGAPKKNVNSFKYGKYTSRIPLAIKNIMEELDIEDPLEKLWRSICLQEARVIYMQDIMHVEDRDDMTKELKKTVEGDKMSSEEFEIQFAWDKEANLINTQSKGLNTLAKLIKQYDDMVHANWNIVTEEQKLRVEKLKNQLKNPEFEHRKAVDSKKLQLERERFEHVKDMDKIKEW